MAESHESNDQDEFESALDAMLRPEPWCIDHIAVTPTPSQSYNVEITGWALAPDGRHGDITFTLNDREFEEVEYPVSRDDIGAIFWFKPGSREAAFQCRARRKAEQLFRHGHMTLNCIQRSTGAPLCTDHSYYYCHDPQLPELPNKFRVRRVSGNERVDEFVLEGYTIFVKLDLALRRIGKKGGLSDFGHILDWGCGCGRLARYFGRLSESHITGVDIDADNLSWCRDHLPFGDFRLVGLNPPMEFEASSFDLVIGISVFTHLREQDQLKWIAELHRITKPGGVLLLSVLGEAGVCRSRWTPDLLQRWQNTGFLSFGGSHDLEGYIPDNSYYVTTYITREWLLTHWSHLFEVEQIIPAYIGNHHDLVILHKNK